MVVVVGINVVVVGVVDTGVVVVVVVDTGVVVAVAVVVHIRYQSNNKLPAVSTFLMGIDRVAGEVFCLVTQNIRLIYFRLNEDCNDE